jgi:hypothetical protein
MNGQATTKERIVAMLDELPPEHLHDVQQFLDFLRFKSQEGAEESAVALGGLLEGYHFDEEKIAQARREMWARVARETE